jgi:hypothetical protein
MTIEEQAISVEEKTQMKLDIYSYVLTEIVSMLNDEYKAELRSFFQNKMQNYKNLAIDSTMDIDMCRAKHEIYKELENRL